MKNFIFTPILKTKEGELLSLKTLKSILKKENFVIPYIRFIYKKTSRKSGIDNFIEYLKENNIASFLEINFDEEIRYRNTTDILSILNNYKGKNFILTFNLSKSLKDDFDKLIKPFLNENNMKCGLILESGTRFNNINEFEKYLKKFNYLFLDCKTNKFNSTKTYIESIGRLALNVNKIVLNEGRNKVTNSEFVKDPNSNMDQSYMKNIDSLISYGFSGLGDYTTVKNDENPNINMGGVKTIAYLLLYNFEEKKFFSWNTIEPQHLGKAYNELHEMMLNDLKIRNEVIDELNNTPIALAQFESYLKSDKAKSTKYISLGITKYIEEVNNGLGVITCKMNA